MYKKLISMVVLIAMFATLLAGCSAGPKAGENDETVTLTVYSQTANFSGELTGWLAQEFYERFNVKINIIPDAAGVYSTRMESGNLGDIVIWGTDGDEYRTAYQAGLLFDWNEDGLIDEYGPYIKENMSAALEKNKEISDGTLYGFGHNVALSSEDHEAFFYTWDLRWDLYKELGYPEVKNLDDYIELLAKMKEIEPVDDSGNPTYAVSLFPEWDGSMVMYVKAMATAYYGYDELGVGLYNVETGELYDTLQEDGPYLEMLRFFNKLYQRDLLDPNSITQTFDEMTAKVRNGGTFFSIFNFAGSIPFNTDEHTKDNKMMLAFTPDEATPLAYGMNVSGSNRIWSIGAATQYPELSMEIINWLATPEGRMVSEHGPKGVTWDYDAEGNTVPTELGRLMRDDKNTAFPAETGYTGSFKDGSNQLNNTTWSIDAENPDSAEGETYNWVSWKSNQIDPKNETEMDWRTRFNVTNSEEYLNSKPYKVTIGTSYAESSKPDELKVTWEQVIKAITDYSWKAMYAKTDREFDIIVDQMIRTATDYGYDECVEWTLGEAAYRKSLEDKMK